MPPSRTHLLMTWLSLFGHGYLLFPKLIFFFSYLYTFQPLVHGFRSNNILFFENYAPGRRRPSMKNWMKSTNCVLGLIRRSMKLKKGAMSYLKNTLSRKSRAKFTMSLPRCTQRALAKTRGNGRLCSGLPLCSSSFIDFWLLFYYFVHSDEIHHRSGKHLRINERVASRLTIYETRRTRDDSMRKAFAISRDEYHGVKFFIAF